MSKHTPGPWKAEGNDITCNPTRNDTMPWRDDDGQYICEMVSSRSIEDTEANARLIAAAPDLLSACEIVQANLSGEPPEPAHLKAALDAVNEAIRIAKAERISDE